MTLVMTAGIGSLFTVMTSDERIAYNIRGVLHPIDDERVVKTYQLTNAVLFGWGGDYDIALKIKDGLTEVVTPGDTLEVCMRHLEQVTDNMEFNRKSVVILSGFYTDGSSGMVMKKAGLPVQELKQGQLEYRYTMFPPTGDYTDRQDEMLYIDEFTPSNILEDIPRLGLDTWLMRSIETTVNHLVKVHGIISYEEPKATTPEGFYYLMYRDSQGVLRTVSGEYDTTSIHEQLKSKEINNSDQTE